MKKRPFWKFPLESEEEIKEDSFKKNSNEKGIALLISLIIILMLTMFTSDMIVTSSVELKLSSGKRDDIKAEYVAKSGLNLASFLILADLGVDLTIFKTLKTVPSDGVSDLWEIDFLQGTPIGPSAIKFLQTGASGLKLSKVLDAKMFEQLNLFDGDFTINIEDESAKINVNECAVGKGLECLEMLNNLMNCPAEALFLEKRDRTATTLSSAIKDWADFNTTPTPGSEYSFEDDPYANRTEKAKPKNDYFDTTDELKQVIGWDTDIHTVFSPYLTVYPMPSQANKNNAKKRFKININSAKRELVSCLLKTYNSCEEKSAIGSTPVGNAAKKAINSPEGLESKLDSVFCDKSKKNWFTFRSDVFRLKIKGEVGDTIKEIETVVHREVDSKKTKKLGYQPVLNYLYWKMR